MKFSFGKKSPHPSEWKTEKTERTHREKKKTGLGGGGKGKVWSGEVQG